MRFFKKNPGRPLLLLEIYHMKKVSRPPETALGEVKVEWLLHCGLEMVLFSADSHR